MNKETFKAAHDRLFQELHSYCGWTLSSPYLKVRHATSPNGKVRIWFKAQALWVSNGDKHTLNDARSLHVEARGLQVASLVKVCGGAATGTMVYAGA